MACFNTVNTAVNDTLSQRKEKMCKGGERWLSKRRLRSCNTGRWKQCSCQFWS